MQRIAAFAVRTIRASGTGVSTGRISITTAPSSSSVRSIHSTRSLFFSAEDKGEDDAAAANVSVDELVPDDFFDNEHELTQEFIDLSSAMSTYEKFDANNERLVSTGLESLTTNKQEITMEDVIKLHQNNNDSSNHDKHPWGVLKDSKSDNDDTTDGSGFDGNNSYVNMDNDLHPRFLKDIENDMQGNDLMKHLVYPKGNGKRRSTQQEAMSVLSDNYMLDTTDLNSTMPRRAAMSSEDIEFQELFSPKTSHELYAGHKPGNRHCEGKKQRSGKRGQLDCHLIDLDALSPFDVTVLRKFITTDSEIIPKYQTGLCSKCQRRVAKTIKHSRNLGILPHIDEYVIRDQAPSMVDKHFHSLPSTIHIKTGKKGNTSSKSGKDSNDGEGESYVSKTVF